MTLICYITRHGETEWNVKKIHQGQLDSELTAEGRQQAEANAKKLVGNGIKIIYSSDLGRCRTTAEIINKKLKLQIIFSKELRERNYGIYQGRPRSEFERDIGNLWSLSAGAPPGGESLKQLRNRVLKFVRSLEKKEKGPILIVTHGGCGRCIISEITGEDIGAPESKLHQKVVGRFLIENRKLKNFEVVK